MLTKNWKKKIATAAVSGILAISLAACGSSSGTQQQTQQSAAQQTTVQTAATQAAVTTAATETVTETTTEESAENGIFTDRDLKQEADTSNATQITVSDEETINITEEGIYIISGSASNCTILIEAADDAKVQLVLDGVSISNDDFPCIYVVSADKVFVTTTDSDNTLEVVGTFTADNDTNTDAVIFSKEDLTLNGTGTLTIESTDNGITCKDDLKVTGGTYYIYTSSDAIEANDSISICDGSFTISSGKDAMHCEYDEDDSVGSIYISGGTFQIEAADDGIQATTTLVIDGGTFSIDSAEGLEATYLQINDGDITIYATDDGINASTKSSAYDVVIEVNGGSIDVTMGAGDTDAFDSNGSIYINGGYINISAQSAFDYDYYAELNGGTVIVNGSEITSITNSMMGGPGGMMGDPANGGMMGGPGNGGRP